MKLVCPSMLSYIQVSPSMLDFSFHFKHLHQTLNTMKWVLAYVDDRHFILLKGKKDPLLETESHTRTNTRVWHKYSSLSNIVIG